MAGWLSLASGAVQCGGGLLGEVRRTDGVGKNGKVGYWCVLDHWGPTQCKDGRHTVIAP